MSAADLLLYNRKNFQWDGKLRVKREYQQQDLRLRQFNLYREDVRDLMELTCGKMDVVLLLDCLMLQFTVLCLVKGHYQSLQWLLWLEFMSLTSAFLLLVVSAYLAMHCSVAAHSFAVRLLTQYVRLPIATSTEIASAVAKAKDFEKSSNVFRLPFVTEQARAALNQYVEVFDEGLVDVSSLDHVKLFRRMQANFMAYDAYARAGTALGTNQLLYGLFYKILGLSFLENHSLVLAIGSAAAFACCAVQLKNLDLKMPGIWNRISHVALLAPLALASTLMVFRAYDFHHLLLPFVFALHASWVVILLFLLKPDGDTDIQLPTKFKQVLFLDVFGFTGKACGESVCSREQNNATEPTPANISQSAVDPSSISNPLLSPTTLSALNITGSPSVPNPTAASPLEPDAAFSPFLSPKSPPITATSLALPMLGELSETRPAPRSQSRLPQPPCTPEHRDAVCNTHEMIHYQFAESLENLTDNVLSYLGQNAKLEFPDFFEGAEKLRKEIQEWKYENGLPQHGTSFEMFVIDELEHAVATPVAFADGDRWICCPSDPNAYYFHCKTGRIVDSLPPGATVIPSLGNLRAKWLDVQGMWKLLMEQSFPRSAEEEKARAKEKDSEMRHRLGSTVDDEKDSRTECEERLAQDGMRGSFESAAVAVDHTIGIGATFHPEEVEVTAQGNTVPGMIPWRLFFHASLTLLFLWAIGTLWSFVQFTLGRNVIYPPFSEWTLDALPVSDLCRTDVTSGIVSEFGQIVITGNWSIACASNEWKALGTASSINVGRTWMQAAHNAPTTVRNASSVAIGRDKMWTLTRPSLITVYELPSAQPVLDFRIPHDVADIFSIKNSLGIIQTSNAGCSARVWNSDGGESHEYRLPMTACSCRAQALLDEL